MLQADLLWSQPWLLQALLCRSRFVLCAEDLLRLIPEKVLNNDVPELRYASVEKQASPASKAGSSVAATLVIRVQLPAV